MSMSKEFKFLDLRFFLGPWTQIISLQGINGLGRDEGDPLSELDTAAQPQAGQHVGLFKNQFPTDKR